MEIYGKEFQVAGLGIENGNKCVLLDDPDDDLGVLVLVHVAHVNDRCVWVPSYRCLIGTQDESNDPLFPGTLHEACLN